MIVKRLYLAPRGDAVFALSDGEVAVWPTPEAQLEAAAGIVAPSLDDDAVNKLLGPTVHRLVKLVESWRAERSL